MKIKIITGIFLSSVFFAFLNNTSLFSIESSLYTVHLEKFSQKAFAENSSKYRIILKESEYIFPDTVNQKILSVNRRGNTCIVLLQSEESDLKTENPQSLKIYLEDTMLLNIQSPGIQKLKQGFNISDKITSDVEDFVYNYISNKSTGVPLISAEEILKDRTGDCTEHTVLAVSILRSLEIPARVLVGMLLCDEFEGRKNVFVYHMWAEAFVKGEWVMVDAANPGLKHPNRYIAFTYHHLRTEMPLSYLKAVSAMKSFTIEYIE